MKSFTTATTYIKTLANGREGRTVSNEAMYTAFNKNPDVKNDVDYMATIISTVKAHGLVKTNYTTTWPRKRESVTLTDKAMQVLSGVDVSSTDPATGSQPNTGHTGSEPVSLQAITDMAREWCKQNPSYRIDPTPKLIDEDAPMS